MPRWNARQGTGRHFSKRLAPVTRNCAAVEALLARDKEAENFLQPPPDGPVPTVSWEVAGSPALAIAAKALAQDLPTATGPPRR